ncbi:hypothetical protein P168DRAFT_8001 [Aspergillus campestris IBT 28561]|uniref:Uncharacterized protein n=1 Tax=Aspergillus campestris (strain IBT 28561) TaxID=1392248 RepID=A0A2I1DDW3_ASPC2|nr:uncharacterized protein P168DRAFT_8001 [Aspergillus campestris IBT 28561]PKY08079.1 hypothetical protein P168DRAFT_8001 [Aspergillus campestris IBT 28561]
MGNPRASVKRKAGSRCWEGTPAWLRRECNISSYDPTEDEPTSRQYPRQTLNWPRNWQCPEPRQPMSRIVVTKGTSRARQLLAFLPLSRLVFCVGSMTNRRNTCRFATFDRHMAPCRMISYQKNAHITGAALAREGLVDWGCISTPTFTDFSVLDRKEAHPGCGPSEIHTSLQRAKQV